MRSINRAAVALLAMAAASAVAADPAVAAAPPAPSQSVIVVMANSTQANAAQTAQLSVNSELSGAQNVHRLSIVNAVSAKVTPEQEANLRANPNVAEVVPDAAIKVIPPTQDSQSAATGTGQATLPPGACAPVRRRRSARWRW